MHINCAGFNVKNRRISISFLKTRISTQSQPTSCIFILDAVCCNYNFCSNNCIMLYDVCCTHYYYHSYMIVIHSSHICVCYYINTINRDEGIPGIYIRVTYAVYLLSVSGGQNTRRASMSILYNLHHVYVNNVHRLIKF